MDEMLKLIHEEIKDMRREISDRNERLASIETSLHILTGNGQPGEIARMKAEISRNSAFRLKTLGALSILSCINLTLIITLFASLRQFFSHSVK